jgi:hypothetical protein
MNKLSLPGGLLLASLVVFLQAPLEAGTGVVVAREGQVLAGASEDGLGRDASIWFVPARKSNLGRVCFGLSKSAPRAGLNDKGLFFQALPLTGEPDPPVEGKQPSTGNLALRALRTCATVAEVRELLETEDLGEGDEQFLFADATGAAILAERGAVHEMSGDSFVATNFRLSRASTGEIPCPRYLAAGMVLGKPDVPSFDATRGALAAAVQDSTLYSVVFDLVDGKGYLWAGRDFGNAAEFDLTKELNKGAHEDDVRDFVDRRLLLAEARAEPETSR